MRTVGGDCADDVLGLCRRGGVTFVMFNFKVNVGTCRPIFRPRVFLSMMLGLILFRGSACNISYKKTCFIYIYMYYTVTILYTAY